MDVGCSNATAIHGRTHSGTNGDATSIGRSAGSKTGRNAALLRFRQCVVQLAAGRTGICGPPKRVCVVGGGAIVDARKTRPMLARTISPGTGIYRIRWTVDARKLKRNEKTDVSPAFELCWADKPFTMSISPTATSEGKGGNSFKNSKGRGSVRLRCADVLEEGLDCVMTLRISISSGRSEDERQEGPRGPVIHDFAERCVCELPRGQDEWDFSEVVDEASQTFVICLEISSQGAV